MKLLKIGFLLIIAGISLLMIFLIITFDLFGGPIRSINDSARAEELRAKLEDPNAVSVSDLLSGDEDLLCVIFAGGGVGAKNDKFNKFSKLRKFDPPWIANDAYWSIVIFSTKNESVEKIFGIARVQVMDLDVNDADMCFPPHSSITRSKGAPPLTPPRFIKFNQEK